MGCGSWGRKESDTTEGAKHNGHLFSIFKLLFLSQFRAWVLPLTGWVCQITPVIVLSKYFWNYDSFVFKSEVLDSAFKCLIYNHCKVGVPIL